MKNLKMAINHQPMDARRAANCLVLIKVNRSYCIHEVRGEQQTAIQIFPMEKDLEREAALCPTSQYKGQFPPIRGEHTSVSPGIDPSASPATCSAHKKLALFDFKVLLWHLSPIPRYAASVPGIFRREIPVQLQPAGVSVS